MEFLTNKDKNMIIMIVFQYTSIYNVIIINHVYLYKILLIQNLIELQECFHQEILSNISFQFLTGNYMHMIKQILLLIKLINI